MKLCASLLMIAGSLFAQGTQTIFVNLFTLASVTGVSSVVRNIGAQYQQLTAFLTDDGSGLCAANNTDTGWDIHLEGSTNNSTWFRFGLTITAIPNPGSGSTFVSAAYTGAYIRVNYAATPSTHCLVTIQYAGTLNGFPTTSAPSRAVDDQFNSVYSGDLPNGTQAIAGCLQGQIAIYAMNITNTTAAPLIISLQFFTDNIGSNPILMSKIFVPANDSKIWAQGPRPYWFLSRPALLQGAHPFFGVTTGAVGLRADMVYRCE